MGAIGACAIWGRPTSGDARETGAKRPSGVALTPVRVVAKHGLGVPARRPLQLPAPHVDAQIPDARAPGVEVARAFAITKLGWIREQQARLQGQARETPREFVERESHYLWGRRHLLRVVEVDARPAVTVDHRTITLSVRPGSTAAKRQAVMHAWHKSLLHEASPPLIARWEAKLGVQVSGYFVQRMKTKWGGCNPRAGRIRLNTELVKKPRDLLEYVVVHELLHLTEPTHSRRFFELLGQHYPTWREARRELNELPVAAELWDR